MKNNIGLFLALSLMLGLSIFEHDARGAPVLVSIAINPPNPTVGVGLTQALAATGTYSDQSTADLSALVHWQSKTLAVATISPGGVLTGVAQGGDLISASLGRVSGRMEIIVVNVPTPCQRCGVSLIGSHAIMYTGDSPDNKDAIAYAASAAHAGMIRIDFSWNVVQPLEAPAPIDWSQQDVSVQAAQRHGLAILAVIYGVPPWASSDPAGPNDSSASIYPPTSPAGYNAWQSFLAAAIARYSPYIKYWEIFPESETPQQWLGTSADYAKLFSLAYTTIKAADPSMQVLIGGMTQNNQPDWINAVLNDPIYPNRNHIDYIVAHTRGSTSDIAQYVSQVYGWPAAYAAQGITGKPFWITEFGFPSVGSDQIYYDTNFTGSDFDQGQRDQAAYYNLTVPWMMTNGVDRLFVTLRDVNPPPFSSEGIVDTSASVPKLSFQVIQLLSDQFSSSN